MLPYCLRLHSQQMCSCIAVFIHLANYICRAQAVVSGFDAFISVGANAPSSGVPGLLASLQGLYGLLAKLKAPLASLRKASLQSISVMHSSLSTGTDALSESDQLHAAAKLVPVMSYIVFQSASLQYPDAQQCKCSAGEGQGKLPAQLFLRLSVHPAAGCAGARRGSCRGQTKGGFGADGEGTPNGFAEAAC